MKIEIDDNTVFVIVMVTGMLFVVALALIGKL